MAEGEKSVYVTRREFNVSQFIVWLYLQLVISDVLRIEWRWSTAGLWVASLAMMVNYAVAVYRGRRKQGEDKTA